MYPLECCSFSLVLFVYIYLFLAVSYLPVCLPIYLSIYLSYLLICVFIYLSSLFQGLSITIFSVLSGSQNYYSPQSFTSFRLFFLQKQTLQIAHFYGFNALVLCSTSLCCCQGEKNLDAVPLSLQFQ